jgi:hypothetical protein
MKYRAPAFAALLLLPLATLACSKTDDAPGGGAGHRYRDAARDRPA